MIALSDPVWVAGLGTAGVIFTAACAAIPAVMAARRGKDNKATLGVANGQGTVAEMAGKTLTALGRIEDRLMVMDRRQDRHEERTARIEDRLDQLTAGPYPSID